MSKIEIIAAGQLKKGPLFELCQEYSKRLNWKLSITEIESRHKDSQEMKADENRKIAERMRNDAFVVMLDERGQSLSSTDFANVVQKAQNAGRSHFQFVIGGAGGLSDELRARANLLLSFGRQTWPHMLARVMLLEQIYRVQQILSGHPYHRE